MNELVVGVRIELRYFEPKIWRRIEMPLYISLTTLHRIIQTAFEWDGYHLAGFKVKRDFYFVPYDDDSLEDNYSSDDVYLWELIDSGIKRIEYTYDFGDQWNHLVVFGKTRSIDSSMKSAKLLGGARCAPIEDMSGTYAYNEYLDYIETHGIPDSEHIHDCDDDNPLSWLIARRFDPEKFDEVALQTKLNEIALI